MTSISRLHNARFAVKPELEGLGILDQCNRGVFRQARQTAPEARRPSFLGSLQEAINRFVAEANTKPKPFHWAKDPDTIIAAVRRGHQVLDYSG